MSNIGLNLGGHEPDGDRVLDAEGEGEHLDEPHPDELHDEHPAADEPLVSRRGSRRAPKRRGVVRSCLPLLLVLVVIAVAGWFGGNWVIDKAQNALGDAPDYTGKGTGSVVVEVEAGASSTAIGRELKAAGVVKSVQAFTDAARENPDSRSIQVGFYELRKQMKASLALEVLVDPDNLVKSVVTVPEGARVADVVKTIVGKTDFTKAQVEAALAKADRLGLPPEADGNPEGYLYPATYTVPPNMGPLKLLREMVAQTKEVEQRLGIQARARELGYSVEEIMTMASLLEYEGLRDADLPKIARVFYNRLERGMALQSDATVAYANNLTGTVWTTQEARDNPSLYNTYKHKGLPPGPIGSPGERTIEAALNPAKGNWLYFVPLDLESGETAFAATYQEHLRNVDKLRAWCRKTNSENCS